MAHGVHPNYVSYHKEGYRVDMNAGVVIKTNVNQSYATEPIVKSILIEIARLAKVPL